MMKNIFYAFMLFLLVSCVAGNPMEREYSHVNFNEDLAAIMEKRMIDSSEILLLGTYIARNDEMGISMKGKNYNQLLIEAKANRKANRETEE